MPDGSDDEGVFVRASRLLRFVQIVSGSLSPRQRRDRLNIAAVVDTYVPDRHQGAQQSLHATLRYLVGAGHAVTVVSGTASTEYVIDGIRVVPHTRASELTTIRRSDLVVTQRRLRFRVLRSGSLLGRPVVFLDRSGSAATMADPPPFALVVLNAEWALRLNSARQPVALVRPPIDPVDYVTAPGSKISMVQATELKGFPQFVELARRLPDLEFLAVRPGYGEVAVSEDQLPPNVELVPHTDDMRAVYSRTRVLVFPSESESYGRVAIEAGLSGIPVIAHPSNGTIETLGPAGIFVHRDDIDGMVAAVRSLVEDPDWERAASDRIRARAECINSNDDLPQFEQALQRVVERWPRCVDAAGSS